MTYSFDFRRHVLKIKAAEDLSYEEAAIRFKVGKASLVRWTKEIASKTYRNKPATKIDMDYFKKDIVTYPDSYYYERATRLGMSKNGSYWAMKRLGVTYKKNAQSSKSQRRTAIGFQEQIERYKSCGRPLFILMKAALLMICRVLMAILPKAPDARAHIIGALVDEPIMPVT